ncbi:phenol 2-monooxygenase [Fusarium phyllophilum]|uniref:Phenol 2-monooxygenase n=1 Tax=Fusarium phyllophilum TaxID=47803 RepID=A0A8H5KDA2_9HYPO|nr:phenol 2-monooxygenase [Fusarium phyllophilum]
MPVTEIKSQEGYEKLLKKYKVVIINAYASWASLSKTTSPIYDRLSKQIPYNPGLFVLARLDVGDAPDLAEKLDIQGVPFFMAYENGERKDSAMMPSQRIKLSALHQLKNRINSLFSRSSKEGMARLLNCHFPVDPPYSRIHLLSRRWHNTISPADDISCLSLIILISHALPPNRGGYGANTGIADAHNLAWKLASVLRSESSSELLDTYDVERRPVADVRHDQIFAREDYKRYVVDKEWPGKNVEIMDDVAMEFGYFYNSKAIVGGPDGSVPVKRPDEWNGQPGTRAPHVAVEGDHVSTLDFFGTSWVVISKDKRWSQLVAEASKATDVKISFVLVGGDVTEKNKGDFNRVYGVEDTGSSLVRPDGFIAWRALSWPAEAQKELMQALGQVSFSL